MPPGSWTFVHGGNFPTQRSKGKPLGKTLKSFSSLPLKSCPKPKTPTRLESQPVASAAMIRASGL